MLGPTQIRKQGLFISGLRHGEGTHARPMEGLGLTLRLGLGVSGLRLGFRVYITCGI